MLKSKKKVDYHQRNFLELKNLKKLVIQKIWSQKMKKKMKTLTKILTMMKHLPTQRLEFLFYAIFQAPKNQRVLFKF